MLSDRAMYLINAGIDGELASGEQAELDALLESSAEARAMKAELQKLANMLEAEPRQSPPPELTGHILDRLAPKPAPFAVWSQLMTPFRPVPVGLAFAAGLLLTMTAYHNGENTQHLTDTGNMTGTMLPRAAQSGSMVDSFRVEHTGLAGTVSLLKREGGLVLEFDLESGSPMEIDISLDDAGLVFGGIGVTSPEQLDASGSYEVSGGDLRIVNQGRQALSVFLPAGPAEAAGGREIRIELSTGGEPVYSGTLRG